MSIIIYIFTGLIIALLQYLYLYGDLQSLLFILKPVAVLVTLFTGQEYTYYRDIGFINNSEQINIGRECVGINFYTILFLMLIFTYIKRIKGKGNRYIFFAGTFIISYIVTILVNASRIIASLSIVGLNIFPHRYEAIVHQSMGILFFLGYLIFIQLITTKLFKRMGDKYEGII